MAPRRTCECGICGKCKHREYMNAYYRRDPQRIRDIANASRARRLEEVRAYDRGRGFRPYDLAKVAARRQVHKALLRGDMERQPCEVGGDCRGRIEAHHEDYTKPLDVTWFCQKHHGEHHRRIAA